MGAKRCVSLVPFVLCCIALGDTSCQGSGTPGTADTSSLLQVVGPEKETKPEPTRSAKLEPHKAAAAPASTKHDAEVASATAEESGKGKVVAATVKKQTPAKDPSETMLQSMLDAFGNYLNRLLFG